MRDFLTVAKFTINDVVRRKSFIISNIIMFAIIVILFNVPNIMKAFNVNSDENTKLLIVDNENIFNGNLEAIKQMNIPYDIEITNDNLGFDNIKEKINNEEIDEAIILSSKENNISMDYIVDNLMYVENVPEDIVSAISNIYTNMQILKLGLSEEEIKSISPNFEFNMKQTEEQEVQGNNFVMMILSLVLFYAIYFYAYQVSTSITTEKTSKIIETLVTSTTPKVIVLGKTIGMCIVGLFQIIAMVIVALISKNLFLEEGMLDGIINLENLTPYLAIIAIVYFILGYAVYALLYALTGSTVSKPEDVQSANGPVAIVAVLGFYLAYFTMMNPTSELNKIAALLPISSPFCMPFRVMMGIASTSEVIISVAILLVSILVVAKISIKIYSQAILNYGSKISFKDAFKLYKNKNV
ncbi:MAG: ABC transporter permease [Clostridia bacterium]|nr:ABC transporter permease [Clostridia bacterium]